MYCGYKITRLLFTVPRTCDKRIGPNSTIYFEVFILGSAYSTASPKSMSFKGESAPLRRKRQLSAFMSLSGGLRKNTGGKSSACACSSGLGVIGEKWKQPAFRPCLHICINSCIALRRRSTQKRGKFSSCRRTTRRVLLCSDGPRTRVIGKEFTSVRRILSSLSIAERFL